MIEVLDFVQRHWACSGDWRGCMDIFLADDGQ